jgi:hypothetical protein
MKRRSLAWATLSDVRRSANLIRSIRLARDTNSKLHLTELSASYHDIAPDNSVLPVRVINPGCAMTLLLDAFRWMQRRTWGRRATSIFFAEVSKRRERSGGGGHRSEKVWSAASGMRGGRKLLHHDRQLCPHYARSIIYRGETVAAISSGKRHRKLAGF